MSIQQAYRTFSFNTEGSSNSSSSRSPSASQLQTTVFLDNSGSMSKDNIALGKRILHQIENRLQDKCRIILFGSKGNEFIINDFGSKIDWDSLDARWNGLGGGTYLWKCILDYSLFDEANSIVVITDGMDNESPAPYNGIEGLHPVAKELKSRGFSGEIHLIGMGDAIVGEVKRSYEALCGATGGLFFHIPNPTPQAEEEVNREFCAKFVEEAKPTLRTIRRNHRLKEYQQRTEVDDSLPKVDIMNISSIFNFWKQLDQRNAGQQPSFSPSQQCLSLQTRTRK